MIVFDPLDGLGSVRHTLQAPPVQVCSPHAASPACSGLFATRCKPRLFRSVRYTRQAPPVQVCSPHTASLARSGLFATHCKPRPFRSVVHTVVRWELRDDVCLHVESSVPGAVVHERLLLLLLFLLLSELVLRLGSWRCLPRAAVLCGTVPPFAGGWNTARWV